MWGRVTTMCATSMGRVQVQCGSADRKDSDRVPPPQKALRTGVDHLQPRKRLMEANEAPRGPGSPAAPPLNGTVGGGKPLASPIAPRTSREVTRGRRSPPPLSQIVLGAVADRLPTENRCAGGCTGASRERLRPPPPCGGSQTVSGGRPVENISVGKGPGRPRDLVQPPPSPQRLCTSGWRPATI